jgi:hypothetical protein
MAWWPVERWEALRLALGARGALPREVGRLIPPQGCPLVPWRLPPLHPLARFARNWQTSDALRRENEKVWLFEILNEERNHVSRARCGILHAASQNRHPGWR